MLAKLNAALREAVANPAYRKRLDELGSLPAEGDELTPAYVEKLVPAEIERAAKLLEGDAK